MLVLLLYAANVIGNLLKSTALLCADKICLVLNIFVHCFTARLLALKKYLMLERSGIGAIYSRAASGLPALCDSLQSAATAWLPLPGATAVCPDGRLCA